MKQKGQPSFVDFSSKVERFQRDHQQTSTRIFFQDSEHSWQIRKKLVQGFPRKYFDEKAAVKAGQHKSQKAKNKKFFRNKNNKYFPNKFLATIDRNGNYIEWNRISW